MITNNIADEQEFLNCDECKKLSENEWSKCLWHFRDHENDEYRDEFLKYLTQKEKCDFEQEKEKAVSSIEFVYQKYNAIAAERLATQELKNNIIHYASILIDKSLEPDKLFFLNSFMSFNGNRDTRLNNEQLQIILTILQKLNKVKDETRNEDKARSLQTTRLPDSPL